MAFKNIEQATEQEYEGYQFIDYDGETYSATFMNRFGVTNITRENAEESFDIYTKDLPKMIKVLQAVYDKYDEDNNGF